MNALAKIAEYHQQVDVIFTGEVARAAGLVRGESEALSIVSMPVYTIDELVSRITDENRHVEIGTGIRTATSSANSPYCPDAGDIIRIDFDPQSGREQSGKRPALVLSPRAYNWPATGFVDTGIGCFMKLERFDSETEVQSRVQG